MAARHRSRKRALQILFEWDMRGELVDAAIAHFYDTLYSEESTAKPKPDKFMEELLRCTVAGAEPSHATAGFTMAWTMITGVSCAVSEDCASGRLRNPKPIGHS